MITAQAQSLSRPLDPDWSASATRSLRIVRLSKRFARVVAVDGVSIEIEPGQMVGIIGRSGAGKSTLLRLVNRLHDPSAGSIRFGELDVSELSGRDLRRWRRRCAMIFQQFNLVDRLDVLTNVLVGLIGDRPTIPTLLKRFSAEDRARAVLALDRLGMAEQALQRADTLSGGQQQRVAIARALVQSPEIVLADEPIASLDPHNATMVMEALRAINREDGITVLCNLHQVDVARGFSDRIVGMARGRIVFDGPPESLTPETVARIYGPVAEHGAARPELPEGSVLEGEPAFA